MQPILKSHKINLPTEKLEFIYHIPEELKAEIINKLKYKTRCGNYKMVFEPIKIILTSNQNDT